MDYRDVYEKSELVERLRSNRDAGKLPAFVQNRLDALLARLTATGEPRTASEAEMDALANGLFLDEQVGVLGCIDWIEEKTTEAAGASSAGNTPQSSPLDSHP